jgi:hypothetical protein
MTEKIEEPNPQGKTTKDNDNRQQIQTQDTNLLSPKAGFCQPASLQTTFVQHE